jgi:hypothetical protein
MHKKIKGKSVRRRQRTGKAKKSMRLGRDNPFADPYFWLSLVTTDYCILFGKPEGNLQTRSIDKENDTVSKV